MTRKYYVRRFVGALCLFYCIDGYSQDCIDSTILSPIPFMGNSGEIFRLADGTIGEVGAEYEYLYEYYPSVIFCPSLSMLIVKGKSLAVSIIARSVSQQEPENVQSANETPVLIESKISDEFEGYGYGNIYKLRNGQIWEQTSSKYRYRYRYAPDVLIVRRNGSYQMQVEGMSDSVTVIRIR